MTRETRTAEAIAALDVGITRTAAASGMAKLTPLHREMVQSLPTGPRQEIRVLHACLAPGDVTPRHSHRHPVTVVMTAGAFTLELDDRAPVTLRAGDIFVEPSGVPMTGRNLGVGEDATMFLFYACDPDTPFADPL